MNKNLNFVAKELFDKIRSQSPNLSLGDEAGKVTSDPEEARFFDFDYVRKGHHLGRISISISEDDGLIVIYSNGMMDRVPEFLKKNFFNFLKELRSFAKQRLLSFDTRDIIKSNLDKRDYGFLSNKSGDSKMSESKLFGTSKTSYQTLGDARIVVKHSSPVDGTVPAGRAHKIDSIYVENAQGERFKYPFKHLNGARAMAQHVSHGGTPYDSIGQHVIGLSEELSKLRMFKNYVGRNPMVAETMGGIQTKVAERIESVKKEIQTLQSPHRYQAFAESFAEPDKVELPEDVMNDWIDRLTIRSFNEELKGVFPYIFKLIDESDVPVKKLDADDLLVHDTDEDDHTDDDDLPEAKQYEMWLDRLMEANGPGNLFSEHNHDMISELNQLLSSSMPVGADGVNAIESLKNIIDDPELMDIFEELSQISPDIDVRGILKDYIQIKDEEHGTNVLDQLNFSDYYGDEKTEEPPAGEPPAEEPADAEEIPETPPETEPIPIPPAAQQAAQPAPAAQTPVNASIEHRGKKFSEVVHRAINAGMKLEDTFSTGGNKMTLRDAIQRAGLKVEDFFGNKADKQNSEIMEFVKSMYDSVTGAFPKGETGVLLAVEKKFGEQAINSAKKVIENLHGMFEATRMQKLAGIRK